jgi:hypothetical protein
MTLTTQEQEELRIAIAEEVEKLRDENATANRLLFDRNIELQKEVDSLKREVVESYFEAAVKSELEQDIIDFNWNRSRAKKVAEGKI